MNIKLLAYIICIVGVLSGCSGTRNLQKPHLQIPSDFAENIETDTASIADLNWWEFYTDSTLTHILRKALVNNHDIQKAAERIEQMYQLYGIDKVNFLPNVGALAGYTRETNKYDGGPTDYDPELSLKLPITWEINLWGALSQSRKASHARLSASIHDYRAMRMTIIAETATAYFNIIALENELAIVRRTLETRKESLHQAKLRYEGGLTAETTYQQAKVEYSTTASLVPDLERRVAIAQNALTLLLGELPDNSLHLDNNIFDPDIYAKFPTGIPSALLHRRPDLQASEMRLRAAMADVGVAYANRFPNLRIGFTPGFENDGLENFFKAPFSYLSAAITGPVFDFGRKKRQYKEKIAVYNQARIDYEKAVVQAFTEVNSAIITYNRVRQSRQARIELREAAVKYVNLARTQYRGGTLNYIDVLDAQRRYFDAQIGVNNALRDEYIALVNLYKSLGGGWRNMSGRL